MWSCVTGVADREPVGAENTPDLEAPLNLSVHRKDRECALGASYGGYMINWILGHTDRFKCIVTHDGMFNAESAWGTTEELWFNDWEFKGTPYDNRASYEKWSPHQ